MLPALAPGAPNPSGGAPSTVAAKLVLATPRARPYRATPPRVPSSPSSSPSPTPARPARTPAPLGASPRDAAPTVAGSGAVGEREAEPVGPDFGFVWEEGPARHLQVR